MHSTSTALARFGGRSSTDRWHGWPGLLTAPRDSSSSTGLLPRAGWVGPVAVRSDAVTARILGESHSVDRRRGTRSPSRCRPGALKVELARRSSKGVIRSSHTARWRASFPEARGSEGTGEEPTCSFDRRTSPAAFPWSGSPCHRKRSRTPRASRPRAPPGKTTSR